MINVNFPSKLKSNVKPEHADHLALHPRQPRKVALVPRGLQVLDAVRDPKAVRLVAEELKVAIPQAHQGRHIRRLCGRR